MLKHLIVILQDQDTVVKELAKIGRPRSRPSSATNRSLVIIRTCNSFYFNKYLRIFYCCIPGSGLEGF